MIMRYVLLMLVAFGMLTADLVRAETAATPVPVAATTIAVVDMQQILSESEAAKNILAQMKTRREALEKEVKTFEAALKKDEQALIAKQKTAKSKEEFAEARKMFEQKIAETRATVQKSKAAADESFNKAISELRGHILTTVSDLATERKIQLVITKQNVVIGDKGLEITSEVMTRLNAKVKAIAVK
jgi:outer membrane protein